MRHSRAVCLAFTAAIAFVLTSGPDVTFRNVAASADGAGPDPLPFSAVEARGSTGHLSQEDTDPSEAGGFRTVGAVDGAVDTMAVNGEYLYTSVGPRLVVRSADAVAEIVGQSPPVYKPMRHLVVIDDHAYATTEDGLLLALDVAEPTSPRPVGSVLLPGNGTSVELAENGAQLFASRIWCDAEIGPCDPMQRGGEDWQYRVWALDTSDAAHPSVLHTIDGVAGPMAASVSHLYVWDQQRGLRAFSYTALAGFEESWDRPNTQYTERAYLATHGSFVYLLREGLEASVLEVLDVSEPPEPIAVSETRFRPSATGLFATEARLHVMLGGTLYVYDLGNVTMNEHVFTRDIPISRSVVARGPVVYLNGPSLTVIETRVEGFAPRPLGSINPGRWTHDMSVLGSVAYTAAGDEGVVVLDIAGAPVEIGRYELGNATVLDVDATESLLVASAQETVGPGQIVNTLALFRVVDRGMLVEVGRMDSTDIGRESPKLHDGYLYTESGFEGGFFVTDVSDPANPRLVSSAQYLQAFPANNPRGTGIAVADGVAYVSIAQIGSRSGGGLVAIDVSDPAAPSVVGWLTGFRAYAVHVQEQHAFLASDVGIVVVDVHDPSRLVEIGRVAGVPDAGDLVGFGPRMVVAAGEEILLVDASSPRSAVVDASLGLGYSGWSTRNIAASPERVIAVAGSGAARDLVAIDIEGWVGSAMRTIPAPKVTGRDIVLMGNTAVVAAGDDGLLVLDTSSRSAPGRVGELVHGWPATEVQAAGDSVYLQGGWRGGFRIVDLSHPAAPRELGLYEPGRPDDGWTQASSGAFTVIENRAYVTVALSRRGGTTTYRIDVVDISDPTAPTLVRSIDLAHGGKNYGGSYLTAHGRYVAVTAYRSVVLLDIVNPDDPGIAAAHDFDENIYGAVVVRNQLCLLTSSGLWVLDTSNPATLPCIGELPFASEEVLPHHLSVGSFGASPLVAALGSNRLRLIELSDPSDPRLIAERVETGSRLLQAGAIDGRHVHVVTKDAGYEIWEANPLAQRLTSQVFLPLVVAP